MQMDCAAAREDIDAYALGALDAEEALALEAHLRGCDDCAALLDRALDTAGAIALSAPLVPGGGALRARVLASAAVLSDGAPKRARAPRWWAAAAAALIVLSAGALTWSAYLQRRVDNLERTNDRLETSAAAQDQLVEIALQPDAARVAMQGTGPAANASGGYLWSPGREAGALVADGLPPLAEGQAYQMWIVYKDRWVSGGTFTVDASGHGRLVVKPDETGGADSSAPLWFCVTVEPAGGGATHTGPMVLRSPRT
jgi:anti-sigma-K factor RskA